MQDCSVLESRWRGIEKFQSHLVVSVGADISSPDHQATQRARGIIRLNEVEGLAGSQRCFSLDSGPMLGHINRRPFVAGFRAFGFNHQNNGFSDWFAFRAPRDGIGIRYHAEEGIQERRPLASNILIGSNKALIEAMLWAALPISAAADRWTGDGGEQVFGAGAPPAAAGTTGHARCSCPAWSSLRIPWE
jgi:hypothetical protein